MFSGANGSLMFTIDSLDVNEHAGFSVAGLGDGDGGKMLSRRLQSVRRQVTDHLQR